MMRTLAAAAASLLFAAGATAADLPPTKLVQNVTIKRFYGYVHDMNTGKYLYTEVQAQRVTADHRWLGGTIDYYAPDGTKIAHKTLDFSKDPYIPLYRLDVFHPKYDEGISKVTASKVYLFKQTASDDAPRRATVDRESPMAADSGFDPLIVDHLSQLEAGKSLDFTLAVAGKLDSYGFTAKRIGETTYEGRKAVKIKVALGSLLSWLTNPLVLTYDAQTGKLLRYEGVSNILNPKTGEVYKAIRVDYSSKPPADAPKNLPPLQ